MQTTMKMIEEARIHAVARAQTLALSGRFARGGDGGYGALAERIATTPAELLAEVPVCVPTPGTKHLPSRHWKMEKVPLAEAIRRLACGAWAESLFGSPGGVDVIDLFSEALDASDLLVAIARYEAAGMWTAAYHAREAIDSL